MGENPPSAVGRTEGGVAEIFAEQLRRIAQARGRARRTHAIDDLAASVQSTNSVTPFLMRMVGEDRHGQRLALEIVLRLAPPLPESVSRLVVPLMSDARFPVPLRLNAAIQVLRSIPAGSPLVDELLQSLLDGINPLRAVERLRFVALHVPNQPDVERRRKELERQTAIACPRCGIQLQRPDLIVHLWQAHRLLMEGSQARDPWKMIEDWLRDYARTGRKELLERSSELGQQLDPEAGLTRVHRLLLAAGLTDEEARENLTAQAEGRRASLCPHCYALAPPEHEALPPPMNLSRGRIAGNGCAVEVSDRYIFTRLYTATPDEVLHDGPEPGRGLTQRGQTIFLTGPLALIALGVAFLLPTRLLPPLTPVSLILLAALLVYLRIRRRHDSGSEPAQRAVDHAWRFLAPEMHRPHFARKDAKFLARLAVTSIGRGSPALREKSLERLAELTKPEVMKGQAPCGDLAALHCLELDDAIRLGGDPVPILVDDLAACLAGDLPLVFGEQLLEAWPNEARDRGQRARLRVLLCARAFEYGFEARDLHELGRVSSIFGQAYASEDLNGLLRLRWLWNNRPARVWQRCGSASTVFDLARYPALGSQYLDSRPDLLLFQPMSVGSGDREAGAPILICEEGIVYRDIIIKDIDTPISVKAKPSGAYDLLIGKQKLSFDQEPALLARRLQGWARFLIRDILPAARALADRRNPAKLRPLMRQKTILCPECHNSFLALRGEVGILTAAE
jgi:hypothetical protein